MSFRISNLRLNIPDNDPGFFILEIYEAGEAMTVIFALIFSRKKKFYNIDPSLYLNLTLPAASDFSTVVGVRFDFFTFLAIGQLHKHINTEFRLNLPINKTEVE